MGHPIILNSHVSNARPFDCAQGRLWGTRSFAGWRGLGELPGGYLYGSEKDIRAAFASGLQSFYNVRRILNP
jgi:hypothetical protein